MRTETSEAERLMTPGANAGESKQMCQVSSYSDVRGETARPLLQCKAESGAAEQSVVSGGAA